MEEKYILTDEKIEHYGRTLYRIKAIKDFGIVKNGDLGGFIKKEENLSHYDNCWVYDNAKIFDNAKISGNAKIFDNAKVFGNAEVYEDAEVFGNAEVFCNALIRNNAKVFGDAEIYDNAVIRGNAEVYEDAEVFGNALILGNAKVFGDVIISNNVIIWKNAFISEANDYISFVNVGSRNDILCAYRTKESFVIQVGCFCGTIDEFIYKVKQKHGDNKIAKEYFAIAEIIRDRFTNK